MERVMQAGHSITFTLNQKRNDNLREIYFVFLNSNMFNTKKYQQPASK